MSDSIMSKAIADELAQLISTNSTDKNLINNLSGKLTFALQPQNGGEKEADSASEMKALFL
jgi:hypothetical protein